jgi:hypothetical protein
MSPRSFVGQGVPAAFLALGMLRALPSAADSGVTVSEGGVPARQHSLGVAGSRAFGCLARGNRDAWDACLKSLRPTPVPADRRARSIAMIRKQDVVEPSLEQAAKLDALRPVLTYLERDFTIEVKLLRVDLAWAGLLEGAAVLISPAALDLLAPAELQAVIAHELAHEYFAREYEVARMGKDYETVREIELRCDAVAIVTMSRLGLDRGGLPSGVAKLIKFNESHGFPNSRDLSPSWDERRHFWRAMAELTESRAPTVRAEGKREP